MKNNTSFRNGSGRMQGFPSPVGFMSSTRSRHRAFTLIELLTVVAIIGILSAITLAALGSVRQTARRAQNVAKLRTLGMACHLYANDNKGKMPVVVINSSGDAQQTEGVNLFSNRQDLLRILGEGFPGGSGAGYVPNADVFYGPFTPPLEEGRTPGQLKATSNVGFRISYCFYSLPASGTAIEPDLFNDRNDANYVRTTPLLADPTSASKIQDTGFTDTKAAVVRLDGSVTVFPLSRFTGFGSYDTIRVLAGLKQPTSP
ncbi:prepilin-type N-terminal cleavage/methylation domain-containing protein [Opitutaceae bacterium TAV1]|nr:prepilin-type N-terminal cleavage/methylation domain-containing protein [Opitutaceae bacterium TAV1]